MNARFHLLWCGLIVAVTFRAYADGEATNAASAQVPLSADALVDKAISDQADGKFELADREASAALAIDPKNTRALEVRGSMYVQEKIWDRAERDYTLLNQIAPDPAYQYQLGQIKFLQRDYSNARSLFAAVDGSRLGDLAKYKVFICDLLGGHDSIAERDLAAFDPLAQQPSYYYAHAAWDLFHHQRAEANQLFTQAGKLFSATISGLYLQALADAQPFHTAVATFATKDGRQFKDAHVFLEDEGLRVATNKGWITVPLDQLPDDLSPFSQDVQEQIITRRRNAAAAPVTATSLVSFTTKSGKTYSQVRWTLADDGLQVLTTDGWTHVPFADLPTNLSSFPADLQKDIAEKIKTAGDSATNERVVSFTTKREKSYASVRAMLTDQGVIALTEDGRVTIPLADLPADLSAFPPEWRTEIQADLKSQDDDTFSTRVVSFTTVRGKSFDGVRAALGDEGLRVLGPDGWVVVTYDQLPADLSSFPKAWREAIAIKKKEVASRK